jgi:menaquinone-dependent protoporphyrinogen oxidase
MVAYPDDQGQDPSAGGGYRHSSRLLFTPVRTRDDRLSVDCQAHLGSLTVQAYGRLRMKKILVTYATLAGTTADVARAVGEEIAKAGIEVDVLPLGDVLALDSYSGVVLGAPMIMGWHRSALAFLRKHRKDWRQLPVAVFVTAMSLTRSSSMDVQSVRVCIDDNLPKLPAKPGHLSFRERYAQLDHYAGPILNAMSPVKPLSLAFFGGRLDYGRLPWWGVVFAMFIIQAPAGDRHNWLFIRKWAAGLPEMFAAATSLKGHSIS